MSSLHPPSLGDASSVQVALGAALATAMAYKLLVSPWLEPPPHERYAAMNGLKDVKVARRLKQSSLLLGDMPELQRNMHRFNDWIHDKTLECDEQPWILHVPTQPDTMVIASPALIEDITKTQNDIFGKGDDQREMLSDLAGYGISIADGKIWYHQRKVASKFFSARMFRDVATRIINKHANCIFDVLAATYKTGKELNFTSLLHQFTLQTFAELGFGLDMHAIDEAESLKLEQAFDKAFPQVLRRVQTPTWLWKLKRYLGIGSEGEYRKTTQYLRQFVSGMISKSIEKIRTEGERKEAATIVELFIHAMQDGEADFPPERLCDIAMVFVLGGRDTTADTLNWLFYMLSKHPDVEEKIRAELWQHVPAVMEGKVPFLNMEQTHSLVYMEAVIKETLRLYPVLPQNGRQASRDTVLSDGTFVPQGTVMALATYAMGRLESIWGEDAAEFKPERFIDETTGKLKVFSSYKFFSFHAGPRVCIGLSLAMLEMKLFIASLLSRFRLDTAPNDGQYDFSFLMPLKDPLLVRVRPASSSAP